MSIRRFVCICLVCLGILLPLAAQISSAAQTSSEASTTVQVPRLIRLSGTLNLPTAASASGVVNLTFALYEEETGGTSLWQETQNVEVDATGHYTVLLGTTQSEGVPIDLFTSGQAQWLGVRLQGEPEQARIMLVSVPFALKAGDAATVGGLPASAFMLANSTATTASSRSTAASPTGKPSSNKASVPSNPAVTGIGTASYIPMWDGTSDIVNSILFQNSSQIGIGTTTPAAPLDVNGKTDIRDTLTLFPRSTDNALSVSGTNFKVSSGGLVTFAPTQLFPGAVTGSSTTGSYLPVWTAQTALGTSPIFQSASNLGIGTTTPNGPLDVRTATATFAVSGTTKLADGIGIFGFHDRTTGNGIGIAGNSASGSGVGVFGLNTSTAGTGLAAGVAGTTLTTTQGGGVFGLAKATTGNGIGVEGQSNSPNGNGGAFINSDTSGQPSIALGGLTGSSGGIAINGVAVSSSLTGQSDLKQRPIGVWGDTHTAGGVGVAGTVDGGNGVVGLNIDQTNAAGYFKNYQTSGSAPGVEGITNSTAGSGVYGWATSATGNDSGIVGQTDSSTDSASGVFGVATAATGYVFGVVGSTNSTGQNASGVFGNTTATTGNTNGVYGLTNSTGGGAVYGNSTATSGTAYGVYGTSTSGDAVHGLFTGVNGSGAVGVASTNGSGSTNGAAGINTATTGNSNGVYGETASSGGVGGLFENTAGGLILLGRVNPSANLFTVDGAGNGFFAGAVQINGNLNVSGTLTKGGGSFKIDHPLDPAKKYLSHSFVESPDMMNIYNGNVTTNKRGLATVVLPDYFEALNCDFRYQLTVIGQFAKAIVGKEINHNRFTIRTDRPGVKVSWQVTGIRQDAWANAYRIPVEEEKPAKERGSYLHPELFGADTGRSVNAQLNQPQAMKQK